MLNVGIECESIEGPESWGVGRIVKKLLEEISHRPELSTEFRFFLYFKSHIPELPYLNNPIFVKKVMGISSFSLYYYVFLPIKLWFEKLDLMFFPNYMLPILFRGKSLTVLTGDIYHEIHSGTLPWRYKLAYKIFAGWSARHATRIMTVSETSKKEVAKLFKINLDCISVNTLGIDPPKNLTGNWKPRAVSQRGKQETGNYILYTGQAFPRRHLRETMLAFESITGQFSDLKLIAIGKDKYNPPIIENLKNEINKRLGDERIIYKEYVSEDKLHQFYAGARLMIYVSSKEAFGLPPLEALSYDVPAVVANQPITHEIFGDNAFFACPVRDKSSEMTTNSNGVENYTQECIAATITEGLTNEAKRQEIKNARRDVLEKYTWQKFVDKFLQFAKNI